MITEEEIWEYHEEALVRINRHYQKQLEEEREWYLKKLKELRESEKED